MPEGTKSYYLTDEEGRLLVDTNGKIRKIDILVVNGTDGREVELRSNGEHIQWRYSGDENWTDLVSLSELKGADGREVELRSNGEHIQWRYSGDENWTDLVSLSELKGEPGKDAVLTKESISEALGITVDQLTQITKLSKKISVDDDAVNFLTNINAKNFGEILWGDEDFITSPTEGGVVVVGLSDIGKTKLSDIFNGALSVPDSIAGEDVVAVGENAFLNTAALRSVTIPVSVKSIGFAAFQGCNSLESIKTPFIGSSRENVGSAPENPHFGYIFGAPDYTSNNSYVPASLKTVDAETESYVWDYSFYDCRGLNKVILSTLLTRIGDHSFQNCVNLTSVVFKASPTFYLGEYAFAGCSKLLSFDIPVDEINRPDGIEEGVFQGCESLQSIVIPDGMYYVRSYAFQGCSGLTSVTIPDSVDTWGTDEAGAQTVFQGCTHIETATMPTTAIALVPQNSLKTIVLTSGESIGGRAFFNCNGLTSVTIPDSVTSIGASAFESCDGLTSVTIGNGVTNIGERAFYNCSGLTSVTIPDSVTSIGASAFSGCSGLTSVTIPDSVTSIGEYAFDRCRAASSIIMGEGVQAIGRCAFFDCRLLTSVNWNAINASNLNADDELFSVGGADRRMISVVIGESVTRVPAYAFYNCEGVRSVVVMGSTSLGPTTFAGCVNIENATVMNVGAIPHDNLKTVFVKGEVGASEAQFVNFVNLTSVTIGKDVDSVALGSFAGCINLESIFVEEGNTKYHSSGNCLIETSAKSLIAGCKTSVIPSDGSVEVIARRAFYNCSGLTSVTIGNGVTSIGERAFYNCSGLTSVTIPDSVTSIGASAFSGCSGLTSITIPDGLTSLGAGAFQYCTGLISATLPTIPYPVSTESSYVFRGCDKLETVEIKDGMTWLGMGMFQDCTSLKNIAIPNSINVIGSGCFKSCYGLTSVVIPDAVTKITPNCFENCVSLTTITINAGITAIAADAFKGCEKLLEVYNKSSLNIVAGATDNGSVALYAKNVYTEEGGSWFTDTEDGFRFFYDGEHAYLIGYYREDEFRSLPYSFTAHNGAVVSSYDIYNYAFAYSLKDFSSSIHDIGSAKSIGKYAFKGSGVFDIVLHDLHNTNRITSIGEGAFQGSALVYITFADGTTTIEDYTFQDCKKLSTLVLPSSITSIGKYAFAGSDINYFSDAEGVTVIEEGAFQGCESLSFAIIPNGAVSIGDYAFQECKTLASITISQTVTSIGASAFDGCTVLTDVTFEGTVAEWRAVTKGEGWNNGCPFWGVVCSDGDVPM